MSRAAIKLDRLAWDAIGVDLRLQDATYRLGPEDRRELVNLCIGATAFGLSVEQAFNAVVSELIKTH